MDFIDFEAGASQSDNVLVPSSQNITSSDRPRSGKRRRIHRYTEVFEDDNEDASDSASDSYDLPSNENGLEDDFDNPKSKYEALLHVPAFAESQENQFVTQVDQPWSSPTAIRGPRWRKSGQKSPIGAGKPTTEVVKDVPAVLAAPELSLPTPSEPLVLDEFDDDDTELIEALMAGESDKSFNGNPTSLSKALKSKQNMRQTTLFGINTTQREVPRATQSRAHNWPMTSRNEPPTHHKIDKAAMQTWTYPLNVGAVRDYQFSIVHRALFHNILVALPTGLGKTFIAATVMLNYFNWTKDAQIVFVAPTKPLVTQQVNACFHIAGIPRSQTTLLTGEVQPAIRAEEWQEKRVFFMTPQTLINDLKTGMADPKKIVLLVVDEAHKATGNYAYVEVVRFLRRFNSSFRVLALTATPGATVEAVQKVIDGLDIARVEIRTEESMDIRSFVHTKNENVELFDNSEEMEMLLDLFATAVRPVLAKVNSLNAYFSNDPKSMTLYGLMKGREQWAKSDAGRNANWGLKGMVQSCFKPLMTLAHNLELLKFHGMGPFYHKMRIFDEEAHSNGKYAKQIQDNESYKTLMQRLRAWVNDENFVGHPKLSYLNEVVLNHFMDAGDGVGAAGGRPPSDTRIMIFAHYRDSAEEIVRVLNRHQPMIRAHVFVGQSGTKGSEGMDQKTQIDIIKKFKAGTYNTLVATSIGEEGLDIGEVDLIVCYDCSKSPIRMLQRMGRTGRKRAGNIVLLLMRGKEERDYHAAKDNYLKMQAIIESGRDFQFHDDTSPRIVPRDIVPAVDMRHVDIPIENTQAGSPEPLKRKRKNAKRPLKKFHMPDNVETGFQFLGNGNKRKTKSKDDEPPEFLWDQTEAPLPPLAQIILSRSDEDDLQRRYAQIAGDKTQYVQVVRLNVHPEMLRQAGKTRLVRHSSTTKRLIQASKAMRNSQRAWQMPKNPGAVDAIGSTETAGTPEESPSSRRSGGRSASFRTEQSDEYDMNDEFIDDGPTRQTLSSSVAESTQDHTSQKDEADATGTRWNTPFYVSQQSMRDANSDAEELPDVGTLFSRLRPNAATATKSTTHRLPVSRTTKNRRARRILSDDSDE